jgi:hypothetical protein
VLAAAANAQSQADIYILAGQKRTRHLIRRDLGLPNLPIIFVQLGPDPHDPRFPYWHVIQYRQRPLGEADIPFTGMVSAKDLHAIEGKPLSPGPG